jgi:Mg-chelatase subunit ChlD
MVVLSAIAVSAQASSWQKDHSAMIRVGVDDSRKIPLILIHGIHGTANCDQRGTPNPYWNDFRRAFGRNPDIKETYSIYIFQYCSDEVEVSQIALELRDLIDEYLTDRNHYILAHSMGGLVAKSYMAGTVHLKGKWANKRGGDTTLEVITLATPHHGTPGANLPKTLEPLFASYAWRKFHEKANKYYWSMHHGKDHPIVSDSSIANRSDLRWDNYDFALDNFKGDTNKKLNDTNFLFNSYASKLIAYSGYLEPRRLSALESAAAELDALILNLEVVEKQQQHRGLDIANAGLVFGLGRRFGNTDGLVPFKSGLFCNNEQVISAPNTPPAPEPQNYICKSPARVRRFESGNDGLVSPNGYPDTKTLSIHRIPRGFDHLDMLENQVVLDYVIRDLRNFAKSRLAPASVSFAEIPTMFLLDVSGSMNDDNKIAQAKSSGLIALKEMQENRKRGRDNSSVAISLFGGECSPNSIRQVLPYTTDLGQAETTFKSRIPKPDGATPLYTAIDLTVDQMLSYLLARPTLREGRVILLSDGQNTCDEQIRPRGVYSQSSRIVYQQVRFLTIGFSISPGSREERDLQYLASASNGRYFPARDGAQLSRVFQKAIRVYVPRSAGGASAEFERGVQAIADRDFAAAIGIFTIYVRANPSDPLGYYNLALACEAMEMYKTSIENYQKYLQLAPGAADSAEVGGTITKLEEDSRTKAQYYADLLRSDLEYLKDYYKRLFGLKNAELSAEFAGFVAEKGSFYRDLPRLLEIRSSRIERNSQELADSLDFLNRRVGLASFDRDAVSLLTTPISYLEELIERIEAYNAQNIK